jgi:hypothetical protein
MTLGIVFFDFFEWIYGEGVPEFLKAWKNIHWFFYHFFSVPLMLRSFFQPIKRLKEKYGRRFNPEKFFENLAINTIMRLVGIAIRLGFLVIAIIFQFFVFIFGATFFAIFLTVPLFIPLAMIAGIIMLIN